MDADLLKNPATIGDVKEIGLTSNGDILDKANRAYVMDVISACLNPMEFRDILFNNPTHIHLKYTKDMYFGSVVYNTSLASLANIVKELINGVQYHCDNFNSIKMKHWLPLVKAFMYHSNIGLNLTTTDTQGNTHSILEDDPKNTADVPVVVSDGLVIFGSGIAMYKDMTCVSKTDRYMSRLYSKI